MGHPLATLKVIVVTVAACIGAVWLVQQVGAFQSSSAIGACAANSSGQMRLASGAADCRANETFVVWNVAGPQGPEGPAGPAGPEGPAGPVGSAGPTLAVYSIPFGSNDSTYLQLNSATDRVALRAYCNPPDALRLSWVPLDPTAPEPVLTSVDSAGRFNSGGYHDADFGYRGPYTAQMTNQEGDTITRFDLAFTPYGTAGCLATVIGYNGGAASVVGGTQP